ncbi:MAG: type 4a pilus biogenesis protein PilO [Phycisphaerales bacterium]|nr:type 4a pilus biogenesis protein PilO [Phycisphaerales bacterium]
MKLNLNRLSPTQIHLIGAALFLLTVSASAYSLFSSWKYHQSGIESSQHKLTQVSDELSTAHRDRGRLVNKIANLQAVVKDHESIIQPQSINELAVQIVALAEAHALEIEQFEPSPPTTLNQNPIQPITIRLSAPYQSITQWLNKLHNTMPDIHVTGLSIVSQNAATSSSVTSTIRLHWYIPTSQEQTQ